MPFDDLANDQDMQSMLKLRGRRPDLPDEADTAAEGDAADPNSLGMQIAQMGRKPYAPAASAVNSAADGQTPASGGNAPEDNKAGSNLVRRILAATQRSTPEIVDMKAQMALPSRIQRPSKPVSIEMPLMDGTPRRHGMPAETHRLARMMVPEGEGRTQAQVRNGQVATQNDSNASSAQSNIDRYMPMIMTALKEKKLDDPEMLRYALATINPENSGFDVKDEGIGQANTTLGGHPFDRYDFNRSLGNQGNGDGELFKGRGFIQLTGRSNYKRMGEALGLDLVNHPELAADPQNAARILAQYIKDRESNIRSALKNNDLINARTAVNGRNLRIPGSIPNGLYEFETSLNFGNREDSIRKAAANNPNMTVGDVAKMWSEGHPAKIQLSYMQRLSRLFGPDLNSKLSDLTPEQEQQLDQTNASYVRSILANPDLKKAATARDRAESLRRDLAAKAAKQQQGHGKTVPGGGSYEQQ